MTKRLEFHPIAADWDLLDGEQYDALRESVRTIGLQKDILLYEGKIADGRNRYRACLDENVEPRFSEFDGTEAELLEQLNALNDARRHDKQEALRRRREARVQRIAEARRQGQSLRAIAEKEEVSETQVRRDLESSTAPGDGAVENGSKQGIPENGKVTGRDGRTRTATPEKTAILCDRCQRVGAVPGCNQCKEASKAAKETKQKAKAEARKAGSETTDAFGNVVPKGCLDAWSDGWIQEAYDFLCSQSEAFRKRRLADGMKKREKHYPFFHAPDFIDGVGFVIEYFDKLIQHVKDKRPAGVCPACGGEKCAECRFSGLVPRDLYKDLAKKVNA